MLPPSFQKQNVGDLAKHGVTVYDNTSPSSAELKGSRLFEFYWKKPEHGKWSAEFHIAITDHN